MTTHPVRMGEVTDKALNIFVTVSLSYTTRWSGTALRWNWTPMNLKNRSLVQTSKAIGGTFTTIKQGCDVIECYNHRILIQFVLHNSSVILQMSCVLCVCLIYVYSCVYDYVYICTCTLLLMLIDVVELLFLKHLVVLHY